jgi:hypothetical protein
MVPFKVFLSHTNGPEDMTIVRRLASNLELTGVTAYVAEDDRQPGNYLAEKIKQNIQSSDWIIGLWTEDSSKSAYVNQELGFAEGKKPYALLVQKGIPVMGFGEGKEYISFDPSDPMLGLQQMAGFIQRRKYKKDDDDQAAQAFFKLIIAIVGIYVLASLFSET